MIARNEEPNLRDCLTSVARLVDEMIVVDTGSSDRTKDIARECGARVFDFAWVDNFAAARNESLRHARGKWILWLDGDERFVGPDREKLTTLLAGLGDENAAYVMKQHSLPESPHGSPTVVDQVRLFRNHPGIRWEYRERKGSWHLFFLDLYIHSRGLGIEFQQVGITGASEVADMLAIERTLLNAGWKPGQNIRVISCRVCDSALGKRAAGYELAEHFKVKVKGPTQDIILWDNGEYTITNKRNVKPNTKSTGAWNEFGN